MSTLLLNYRVPYALHSIRRIDSYYRQLPAHGSRGPVSCIFIVHLCYVISYPPIVAYAPTTPLVQLPSTPSSHLPTSFFIHSHINALIYHRLSCKLLTLSVDSMLTICILYLIPSTTSISSLASKQAHRLGSGQVASSRARALCLSIVQ